ncbi:hypothetical protein BN9982_640015 [Mycobacterium tuberculosis]|nr:hypothetical protein BN9982_640015 [Mycobacterium tuberculosis]
MSTLTTQSRHPDPRAAQSSQSITTGAPGPGAVPPLVSGPLRAMGSFLSAWLMRSSER